VQTANLSCPSTPSPAPPHCGSAPTFESAIKTLFLARLSSGVGFLFLPPCPCFVTPPNSLSPPPRHTLLAACRYPALVIFFRNLLCVQAHSPLGSTAIAWKSRASFPPWVALPRAPSHSVLVKMACLFRFGPLPRCPIPFERVVSPPGPVLAVRPLLFRFTPPLQTKSICSLYLLVGVFSIGRGFFSDDFRLPPSKIRPFPLEHAFSVAPLVRTPLTRLQEVKGPPPWRLFVMGHLPGQPRPAELCEQLPCSFFCSPPVNKPGRRRLGPSSLPPPYISFSVAHGRPKSVGRNSKDRPRPSPPLILPPRQLV